jgi:catechol 2,3-dioxygenase-like lactoylglutathione lyase family enzyme
MKSAWTLRVARPTDRLTEIAEMYRVGLGFTELARFAEHDGFDGVILGHPDASYHLEFTTQRGHSVGRAPTKDHLLVFYLPNSAEWKTCCARMIAAGFRQVESDNPYWNVTGRTFEDPDGYRVVLQNDTWSV